MKCRVLNCRGTKGYGEPFRLCIHHWLLLPWNVREEIVSAGDDVQREIRLAVAAEILGPPPPVPSLAEKRPLRKVRGREWLKTARRQKREGLI